jgi:hypothetical protein
MTFFTRLFVFLFSAVVFSFVATNNVFALTVSEDFGGCNPVDAVYITDYDTVNWTLDSGNKIACSGNYLANSYSSGTYGGTLYNPVAGSSFNSFEATFWYPTSNIDKAYLTGFNSETYDTSITSDDIFTLYLYENAYTRFYYNGGSPMEGGDYEELSVVSYSDGAVSIKFESNGSQIRACVKSVCGNWHDNIYVSNWDSMGFRDAGWQDTTMNYRMDNFVVDLNENVGYFDIADIVYNSVETATSSFTVFNHIYSEIPVAPYLTYKSKYTNNVYDVSGVEWQTIATGTIDSLDYSDTYDNTLEYFYTYICTSSFAELTAGYKLETYASTTQNWSTRLSDFSYYYNCPSISTTSDLATIPFEFTEIATTTCSGSDFFCALNDLALWLFNPDPVNMKNNIDKINSKVDVSFPFNVVSSFYSKLEIFEYSSSTQSSITLPFYDTDISVLSQENLEDTIGYDNYFNVRQLMGYIIYLMFGLFTLKTIRSKIVSISTK